MILGCAISEEFNKILHSSRGEGVGIVKVGETFNEDGEKMINCVRNTYIGKYILNMDTTNSMKLGMVANSWLRIYY